MPKFIFKRGFLVAISGTSFLISSIIGIYLLRHTIQYQKWTASEWLLFWQLIVIFITAVIGVSTIIYGKKTSKQRATLDVILNEYQDGELIEAKEEIFQVVRNSETLGYDLYDVYQDKNGQHEVLRSKLLMVLNRHEFYSSAMNLGILDEELFRRLNYSNFIRLWNAVSPTVMCIREEQRKETIFKDLEILTGRWKANPLTTEELR